MPSRKYNITIPLELWQRLWQERKDTGVSFAEITRRALVAYLNRGEKQ